MDKKHTILMSFLNHRETDGRVFYRETRLLIDRYRNETTIKIISMVKSNETKKIRVENDIRYYLDYPIEIIRICSPESSSFVKKLFLLQRQHLIIRKILKKINPDIYFIADVRELKDATHSFKKTQTKVFYDSHEDYVRQALDYGTGVKKHIIASLFNHSELTCIRKCEAVFCTDEHLLEKYGAKKYKAKNVFLMRNYPYYDANFSEFTKGFAYHDTLKMVYIGGVDKYRGIIESVEYIQLFNQETEGKKITLDVYGNNTEIAKAVSSASNVFFHDWIDQSVLMEKLKTEYDVGLCLWQPIPKFFLNLPIKNFDYMGAGLPFITSNFGNLKTHAEKSKAGFCIDPTSYEDFKQAVLKMFDPLIRKELSENGLKYVKEDASFQLEAKPLIELIQNCI